MSIELQIVHLVSGFMVGVACGIVIDQLLLGPLILWHARRLRRGRGR